MNASPTPIWITLYPLSPNSPIVNTTNIFSYQQIPSTYSSLSPSQKKIWMFHAYHLFFFGGGFTSNCYVYTYEHTAFELLWNSAFITMNFIFQKSGEKCYKTRASNNGPLFFDANEKINRLLGGLHWMGFNLIEKKWQQPSLPFSWSSWHCIFSVK